MQGPRTGMFKVRPTLSACTDFSPLALTIAFTMLLYRIASRPTESPFTTR